VGVADGGKRVAFDTGSGWWRAEVEGRGERDKLVDGGVRPASSWMVGVVGGGPLVEFGG
jgi:hypothetical protein